MYPYFADGGAPQPPMPQDPSMGGQPQGPDPAAEIQTLVQQFVETQSPEIAVQVVSMLAEQMGIMPAGDPAMQGGAPQDPAMQGGMPPQEGMGEVQVPQGSQGMKISFYKSGGSLQKKSALDKYKESKKKVATHALGGGIGGGPKKPQPTSQSFRAGDTANSSEKRYQQMDSQFAQSNLQQANQGSMSVGGNSYQGQERLAMQKNLGMQGNATQNTALAMGSAPMQQNRQQAIYNQLGVEKPAHLQSGKFGYYPKADGSSMSQAEWQESARQWEAQLAQAKAAYRAKTGINLDMLTQDAPR